MKCYFDLSGTIMLHDESKAILLMPHLLQALGSRGDDVIIISRWSEVAVRDRLEKAGVDFQGEIVSAATAPKGTLLAERLDGIETVFIDDKPENLASVRDACGERVRLVGFVGSGKYCPKLASWCFNNSVELALSPPDLIEGLGISVGWPYGPFGEMLPLRTSESDLAMLIPGLDHPFSSMASDAAYFDHREIFMPIFHGQKPFDISMVTRHLAWITSSECLWKGFVIANLRMAGIDENEALGKAYKHYEYTEGLTTFLKVGNHPEVIAMFRRTFAELNRGIVMIGKEAERCRIGKRPIEEDRLGKVANWLRAAGIQI